MNKNLFLNKAKEVVGTFDKTGAMSGFTLLFSRVLDVPPTVHDQYILELLVAYKAALTSVTSNVASCMHRYPYDADERYQNVNWVVDQASAHLTMDREYLLSCLQKDGMARYKNRYAYYSDLHILLFHICTFMFRSSTFFYFSSQLDRPDKPDMDIYRILIERGELRKMEEENVRKAKELEALQLRLEEREKEKAEVERILLELEALEL